MDNLHLSSSRSKVTGYAQDSNTFSNWTIILIFNVGPYCMMNITNWEDIVKKEARGINDYDLGEVHEVEPEVVVTKKGVVDKDKFYLPKKN